MSALARRGYDPWLEADRMARLPPGSAVRELADAIAGMPALTDKVDPRVQAPDRRP